MNKKVIIIGGVVLLAGGAAALYFMNKNSAATAAAAVDPEVGDFKPTPGGALVLAPGLHAAYATRVNAFVSPHPGQFYPEVYADVMKVGMPQYTALINSMSQPDQQTMYHLVNDTPAAGIQPSDPTYAPLVAVRDKYKILFY